jgi:hypothetical protein
VEEFISFARKNKAEVLAQYNSACRNNLSPLFLLPVFHKKARIATVTNISFKH